MSSAHIAVAHLLRDLLARVETLSVLQCRVKEISLPFSAWEFREQQLWSRDIFGDDGYPKPLPFEDIWGSSVFNAARRG